MADKQNDEKLILGNDGEGDEYVESVENSIDRMRDEGGIAPELPHSEQRAGEIQRQLEDGSLHS